MAQWLSEHNGVRILLAHRRAGNDGFHFTQMFLPHAVARCTGL